ncbi:hypoxanthine phosphoribosyltransferase [Phosphitispora fastidiosa]|uniref:hypoxanthine phosphoribosyltransferase n=1 Tax=Phosphitispora fastidiosa TaxID=2837202 RepID=UPI001E30E45D|nr:hypoxanthine phosphoribosyltransferase [Phosphitispora fastidiosa]MBU7008507.1 hypoxanthine phosphoribosyltransferase [Phosphitispora fastidiosa]
MLNDVEKCLISREQIAEKVALLGQQISEDYRGKDLIVVGILKGAVVFLSDLIREISIPLYIDFMAVSSYGSSTESSGVVRILNDLDMSIEGMHVLIVEDIVDTGLTLKYLVENLKNRKAASVKVCTLLEKPARRKVKVDLDYNGFVIPDEFAVGYGLDYNNKYRSLPGIYVLKKEIYSS